MQLQAYVQFIDRTTGAILLEKEVDGRLWQGFVAGGESIAATRGLANEVAKVVRREL